VRLVPNIRFGTERYPEKVARRLRAVNITAWIAAPVAGFFALWQFLDPTPGLWKVAAINLADMVFWAAIPLLHRFGPSVGALALALSVYASHFVVILLLGTATGMQTHYLIAIALVVLFFGTEGTAASATLAALAVILIVVLEFLATRSTNLVPEPALRFNFIVTIATGATVLYAVVRYAVQQIARAEAAAEREHARSEALLANILPPRIAARLKERAEIADAYPEASVLFADMAGFTARAGDTAPDALVRFLNDVFTRLDALVERHGLEKIKTTGDSYMVVSGVPEPRPDHAEALAALALDMREALAGLVDPKGRAVPVRIGIASGAVVAGVVGSRKFFYDVWGDAVNTASRMEQTGEAGKIQVAPETYKRIEHRFDLAPRGIIEVRGKGAMRTCFLIGRKPAPAASHAAATEFAGPTA
jgi:adenylate cyclase